MGHLVRQREHGGHVRVGMVVRVRVRMRMRVRVRVSVQGHRDHLHTGLVAVEL